MKDMALFVWSRPRLSRLLNGDESGRIRGKILERCRGIFLWASLTMVSLDDIYSMEDIENTLQQAPSGMNGLYSKIIEIIMGLSDPSKAHCILKSVVCAPSPLRVEELQEAVRLNIRHIIEFGRIRGSIFSDLRWSGLLGASGVCAVDASNSQGVSDWQRIPLLHQLHPSARGDSHDMSTAALQEKRRKTDLTTTEGSKSIRT